MKEIPEQIRTIPLTEIDSFENHPFQIKLDNSMREMVQSIKSHGVQTPALVRRQEDVSSANKISPENR